MIAPGRAILAAALLAPALCAACRTPGPAAPARAEPLLDAPPLHGTLRLSTFGDAAAAAAPALHTTVFVNGPDYAGMEDNDLRGFLDGTFVYGWNQATQVHVRVGRRDRSPQYGEFEIFRVCQRWADVRLPPRATVSAASLTIFVEVPPAFPVRLMLYEIRRDWNPGAGGTLHDNVSPPVKGEVWWNARAHEIVPWGLPGAGFASDVDPRADTPAMPLAEAMAHPADTAVVFESEELARYATRRIGANQPLLFLLKLADFHEDTPGTTASLYSGNHGDSRNTARRPTLSLTWSSAAQLATFEQRVLLERGRSYDLPAIDTAGAGVLAWSFEALADGPRPALRRAAEAGGADGWVRVPPVASVAGEPLRLRLLAAEEPLTLGHPFVATLTDTWVRTAPPEEQAVPWSFVSPSGARHETRASYRGESTWSVEFTPDEPGPWRYSWSVNFSGKPFRSAEGAFDVVLGDRANARAQLEAFLSRIVAEDPKQDATALRQRMIAFARLERAALQLETAESFASTSGAELRRLLNRIRARLGEPVPDPIPLVPDRPPAWARRQD